MTDNNDVLKFLDQFAAQEASEENQTNSADVLDFLASLDNPAKTTKQNIIKVTQPLANQPIKPEKTNKEQMGDRPTFNNEKITLKVKPEDKIKVDPKPILKTHIQPPDNNNSDIDKWSWGSVWNQAASVTSKGISSASSIAKTVVGDENMKLIIESGEEELKKIKSDFSSVAKKITETIAPSLILKQKVTVWLCCQLKSEIILNVHHDHLQSMLNSIWLVMNRGFAEIVHLNSCVDDDVLTNLDEAQALERINVINY
jgi:hypothetical protein